MKYFVTGATGFLGRELVRQLRAQGHAIHALVRDPARAGELNGVRLFDGDVTEKESMREGMRGVDGVFHVAGWYKIGTRDKRPAVSINIQGTRNTLELMKELAIPKGVYVSTLAVHSDTHGRIVDESYRFTGRHVSEYDRTKAAAHDIALEMIAGGLPLVIAMPGIIYGPGDRSMIGRILQDYLGRDLAMVPRGTGFCWTYMEDASRGLILTMEKGRAGESYHLCGEPVTLVDALDLAEEITGIPTPPSVPAWMLNLASVVMGWIEKIRSVPELYSSETLRVSAGVTYWGDDSKARRELGFAPRPLREGLRSTLLQDEPNKKPHH